MGLITSVTVSPPAALFNLKLSWVKTAKRILSMPVLSEETIMDLVLHPVEF